MRDVVVVGSGVVGGYVACIVYVDSLSYDVVGCVFVVRVVVACMYNVVVVVVVVFIGYGVYTSVHVGI